MAAAPDAFARLPGRIARTAVLANGAGALTTYLYLQFVAPGAIGPSTGRGDLAVSGVVFVAYLGLTMVVGLHWAPPTVDGDWLAEGRSPTATERQSVLSLPFRVAAFSAAGWFGAAVVFGFLNVFFGNSALSILRIVVGIVLGGVVTVALTFSLLERVMRPMVVAALAGHPEPEGRGATIENRLVRAWIIGSAVPLVAVGLTPVARTGGRPVDLAYPIAFLVVVGLVVGYLMVKATASAVSEPLRVVRGALETVRGGDLSTEVPVDDAGEIGQLEAGVNEMVEGLRERRRIEDLFGRYVGEDVARNAVAREAGLGGEQRRVSVLFVDLVGSTTLAATRPAAEVVEVLNALFGCVVSVTESEGGWVNKFEGDAALCVFGAPVEQEDHARRALRAARSLRRALEVESADRPDLRAAIGVATGSVVAGNVGALNRYEYTVIGDAVNEAARLTDAAKAAAGRTLASREAVDAADGEEASQWESVGTLELRGRSSPTELMAPRAATAGGEAGSGLPLTARG